MHTGGLNIYSLKNKIKAPVCAKISRNRFIRRHHGRLCVDPLTAGSERDYGHRGGKYYYKILVRVSRKGGSRRGLQFWLETVDALIAKYFQTVSLASLPKYSTNGSRELEIRISTLRTSCKSSGSFEPDSSDDFVMVFRCTR